MSFFFQLPHSRSWLSKAALSFNYLQNIVIWGCKGKGNKQEIACTHTSTKHVSAWQVLKWLCNCGAHARQINVLSSQEWAFPFFMGINYETKHTGRTSVGQNHQHTRSCKMLAQLQKQQCDWHLKDWKKQQQLACLLALLCHYRQTWSQTLYCRWNVTHWCYDLQLPSIYVSTQIWPVSDRSSLIMQEYPRNMPTDINTQRHSSLWFIQKKRDRTLWEKNTKVSQFVPSIFTDPN